MFMPKYNTLNQTFLSNSRAFNHRSIQFKMRLHCFYHTLFHSDWLTEECFTLNECIKTCQNNSPAHVKCYTNVNYYVFKFSIVAGKNKRKQSELLQYLAHFNYLLLVIHDGSYSCSCSCSC